ncbi:MAG: hypothetical protein ACLURP_13655 [Ruminococcus sp.]
MGEDEIVRLFNAKRSSWNGSSIRSEAAMLAPRRGFRPEGVIRSTAGE